MLKPLAHSIIAGLLACCLLCSLATASAQVTAPADAAGKQTSQAYLYLQPFSARVEALFHLPMMMQWLGLPMDSKAAITGEEQVKIRAATVELVADWCSLAVDNNRAIAGTLVGVVFFKGEPSKSQEIAPTDVLSANEMLIGLVWEFPLPPGPESIDIKWNKFLPPLEIIPLQAQAGREIDPLELYVKLPVAHWFNRDRLPRPRPPMPVPPYVEVSIISIPVAFILALILGFFVHGWVRFNGKKYPGGFMPFFMAWLFGLFISWNMFVLDLPNPFSPRAEPITTKAQAEAIVSPLLHNLYRSFDHLSEPSILELLSASVDSVSLEPIYTLTSKALTLPGADKIHVQVSELALSVDSVTTEGRGFIVTGEWTVLGKRSHWGHPDSKAVRFRGSLSIQPSKGEWRVREMKVTEQR